MGGLPVPFSVPASSMKKQLSDWGLDSIFGGGLFVAKLVAGGPAYQGGIRPNDIILKFNGKAVKTVAALRDALNACKVGDTVPVTILRGDDEVDKSVTLTEIPRTNS